MTDQTPSLDSLCETIRELLPKVTPLLAPEDVDGGTMVIDDPDSQTLSAVQTGDASPRAFGMWKKDAEFFAWCLIHRRLIALAPTMATALLSLESERAKQEAGSREADIDALCKAMWWSDPDKMWDDDVSADIAKHPNASYSRYCQRRRDTDRARMRAFIASPAWQAASKPAAVNVEKAAEEIADAVWARLHCDHEIAKERFADTIRKHLTEAPALSDEQRMVLGEALWRAIVEADLFKLHTTNAELWRLIGLKAETAIMRLTSSEGSGAKEGK